jgi:hypothetical protein
VTFLLILLKLYLLHCNLTQCHAVHWKSTIFRAEEVKQETGMKHAASKLHAGALVGLFPPRRWRGHVPLKCQLDFNVLHGFISQKTELFITTAFRTSNPTSALQCFRKHLSLTSCFYTWHKMISFGPPTCHLTSYWTFRHVFGKRRE